MSKDKECFVPCADQGVVDLSGSPAISGRLAALEGMVSSANNRITELEAQIASVSDAVNCLSEDVESVAETSSDVAAGDALKYLQSYTMNAGHDADIAASLWSAVLKKLG
ncbi:hypothetical protein [Salipiger sp. PrR003]|uniref:hypothetical protein n=1 Tax=Salipiger sp. PrR003 TaxID=2706776 RepID=UPI0013DA7846|nr:hypothetical protein [Salipiger sp. PrR003]NDV53897.1 hypothetical protein [Salipiger sp. PrR003]